MTGRDAGALGGGIEYRRSNRAFHAQMHACSSERGMVLSLNDRSQSNDFEQIEQCHAKAQARVRSLLEQAVEQDLVCMFNFLISHATTSTNSNIRIFIACSESQ